MLRDCIIFILCNIWILSIINRLDEIIELLERIVK